VRLQLRLHNVFDPTYRERLQALALPELKERVWLVEGSEGGVMLSPEGMADIYRSSHCFVFPSKGEGWGLPLIEAISCGTPFIATPYSGPLQYLRHCRQSFSQIEYQLEEIREPDYLHHHHFPAHRPARWAKPDVPSLARQMRQVYENWPAVREQAQVNARRIHQCFSWAAAAEALVDVLVDRLRF
jgi:glycosyltransferase involved in cell wall biosynthesis